MGEGINNRLLFKDDRQLFSLLFAGNFCGVDKDLIEGDKVVSLPPPPPLGKTLHMHVFTSVNSLT